LPPPIPVPPAGVAPSRRFDTPLAGIALATLAMASFSCSDAISKFLTGAMPAVEIAWLRWCGFLGLMLPSLIRSRGRILISHAPLLQIGRGLGLLGSAAFFIAALHLLPMATATATSFVSPMLVTALSIPLLGERVGLRRWAAVGVGLVGMLIVVRPGTDSFHAATLLPLLSALCWAFGVIFTRKSRGLDGPLTAMSYTAVVGVVLLSAMVPFEWVAPTPAQIALAMLMSLCSTAAQLLTVLAYYRTPAAVLAPISYTQLIWSTLFGYVIFANVPDLWTLVGSAVIVSSGLYTAHRERTLRRGA
jgi:drug/metabolite transporter (DMT)-like permease